MEQDSFTKIVNFHPELEVMDVNFSELVFVDSKMVDEVYDQIEAMIHQSGKEKWYFLVNYKNCRIYEFAWIRFSQRGKRVNLAHSLGSVRYAVQDDLGQSIESSAQRQDFDPNLFESREDALAEIDRMRKS
ncbi:MAG: hypothetical protein ACI845_000188 [Gammaproteobacteria bacterium]|jgi:hypothetical protein